MVSDPHTTRWASMKLTPRSLCSFLWLPQLALAATPELALQEHVQLTVNAPDGAITVVAGSGMTRTYKWGGCSLDARMRPRPSRWFGSLGIYDSAPSNPGFSTTRQCQGISRTVVEEGQIHFDDAAAASEWLRRYAAVRPTVWSSDGLVVQWSTTPGRDQLSVDVWQVCVASQYPTQLSGAKDSALQVTRLAGVGPSRHACVSVTAGVVAETHAAWQRHWESVEQWKARAKPRN